MIRSKSEDDRQKSICDKGGEKMGEWQGLRRSAGNISKHLDDNKPYFPVPFFLVLFLMMFLLETRETAAQHHHYFSFDGKDDYIALQMEYQGAEVLSEVTIEAWVRTGFSGAWYYDNWAVIDFDRSEFYTVYIRGDNGRVGFSTYGGTVDDFQGITAVNDGQWHHVAAVYDGTNKYLYVDGVLEATKPNPHGGSALGKSESVRYGMIGDGSEATTYNGNRNHFYYEGDIAEVRIWHLTRSASEIQAHIGPGGLAGAEAGLAAYYTFEDGTARDLTGNGHDGALFGPAFQRQEPVPAPFASFDPTQGITLDAGGQVQSWGSVEGNLTLSPSNAATSPTLETEGINGHPALAFDGVDNYLLIPNLEGLNLGGPFDAKTLTLVFQTGNDVTNRQLLYEQGGATRGLNLFIEAGQLSYSAWNNGEAAWGPLTVTTSVAPVTTYVATLVLDAVAGTLTGYLNNQLVCALDGVKPLYAHSNGGGLGNKNSYTLFPDGSRTTGAFGGKVAFWSTYNTLLATAERDQLEQALIIKYLDTYLPTLLVAPDDVSLTVINENEVMVSWKDNEANETAYQVERSGYSDGGFMVIGTTPADGTNFTDNTSAEGTTYYYQVRAVNATAVSAYSRIVKIEIPFSEPEPVEITRAFTHTPLFTGNISAIRWRNANDTIDQLYSFQYDSLNRLTSTQYAAYQDGTYQQEGVFAVPRYSYDLNGNVTSILRQGKNLNGAVDVIDDLSFHYGTGSNQGNQLRSVTDERGSAGFEDGTTSGDDYAYDANGNLLFDRNKGIDTIYYNHLNLPSAVVLSLSGGKEKDSLSYLYNAGGTKLQQKHYQADTLYKTTDYLGSRIYETLGASGKRTLVEIAHPEGRIVPVRSGESQAITSFDYQYHITDHLGNVRMTFSTTPERYEMVEDFENGAVNGFTDLKEHTDENANTTEPYDACNKASRLEIGETSAMLFLHVDKNDTIRAQVNASYTHSATGNTFLPIAYDALFGSYNGNIAYGEAGGAVENEFNEALRGAGMAGKDDGPDVPRAFINFIFFDKAMRYQRAGFTQISTAAYQTAPHQHETVALEAFVPDREGYILLYLSNENHQPVTVFFDDFVVKQRKTNVVFSSDYYPYGLSYHRFERTAQELRNRYGYQSKEYLDEEGLDTYDFHARYYDPALGRFTTVDPQHQFMSGYVGMGNNPVMMVDPDGEVAFLAAVAIGAAIGAGVSGIAYGVSTAVNGDAWNWGDFGISFGTGAISGALTTAGSAFGPVGMVLGGSVAGGINSSIGGGSFGRGAWTGAVGTGVGLGFSSAVDVNGIIPGALFGSATGGLTSGGLTALQGGNFWSGFEQGAISGGISGGIGGYWNARANGRSASFGNITEKSVTSYANRIGVDLTQAELDHIMVNRKGLDLVKYFNDLPNTQILIGQLWGGEVVDDQGFGWWDYYEAEVAAYKAYMRSGAITPVYPESYLIGGYSGIKALKTVKLINKTTSTAKVKGIDKFLMHIKRNRPNYYKGKSYTNSIKYWRRGKWRHLKDWE